MCLLCLFYWISQNFTVKNDSEKWPHWHQHGIAMSFLHVEPFVLRKGHTILRPNVLNI